MNSSSLQALVGSRAGQAGFAVAGIASVPAPGSPEDQEERSRFVNWVEAGRAGEMEYLKRRDDAGNLVRSSVRIALPWARSVIVCAANYNAAGPRSIDPAPEAAGWIARYACTGQPSGHEKNETQRPSDYHKVLHRRLEGLRDNLTTTLGPFESRCFVDTGPVVERVYARYAGIGWVGKNTCILNQNLGSWLFLGVIVTSLDIPTSQSAQLQPDRCGSCTRCIDACPTSALTAPRQMDATRCISYLTIEKRGAIPEELRPAIDRQIFGCDICQDVCPWNRRAPIAADSDLLRARPSSIQRSTGLPQWTKPSSPAGSTARPYAAQSSPDSAATSPSPWPTAASSNSCPSFTDGVKTPIPSWPKRQVGQSNICGAISPGGNSRSVSSMPGKSA